MKKLLCLLLAVLMLPIIGCKQEQTPLQRPITVYYRRMELTTGATDSVIAPYTMDGAGYEQDLLAFLNLYLKGPKGTTHATTFPISTKILTLEVHEDHVHLLLNPSLSQTGGMDLTIACACLSKTVMELTGTVGVTIRVSGGTLNGASYITMTADTIHLIDTPAN